MKHKNKKWYQYLWIISLIYITLGFFNILSAWIGLICFIVPILISTFKGNKSYCNKYCGRGQLLDLLGNKYKLSRNKNIPRFIKSKYFRYGFLVFFMFMFGNMIFSTYLVFSNSGNVREVVKLLWTINMPWDFAYNGSGLPSWIPQFAFGFYSLMLTSSLLGIITMFLYKPRSWCVYCPMGTMTQTICKIRNN